MSGRSGATASVRSCGSVRAGPAGGRELVLDALYDRKRDKKTVRVLTVIVYVFCVSLAAIMLSLYYVFFWEPKDAQYAQRKVLHKLERQTSTAPTPTCFTHTVINLEAMLCFFENFIAAKEATERRDPLQKNREQKTDKENIPLIVLTDDRIERVVSFAIFSSIILWNTFIVHRRGGTKINGTNTTRPAENAVGLMNTSAVDEPATAPVFSTKTASTTAQGLYNSTSKKIGTLNETDIGTLNRTGVGTLNETDNIT